MQASSSHEPSHLKRTLGLPSVLLFGLAYMAPLISYGKLARLFPVAGSAYTYTRKTFNAHLGFMIGWATLLDYFFLPMVIWLIGAAYLGAAFPSVPTWIWIVAFIVLTSALN